MQTLTSVLVLLLFIAGLRSSVPFTDRELLYPVRDRYGHITEIRPEIAEIAAFLKDADKIMPKSAEFVAFPQGAMLNFLTKRKSPLPYVTFLSAEVARYGEGEMLRSFAGTQAGICHIGQ